MSSDIQPAGNPKWMTVLGWIFSVLPALALLASGGAKLMKVPEVVEGLKLGGWSESALMGLGIVEIASAVLYLIPRTAVLGAILLTGYLGGAVATHVRFGDAFSPPILFGALVWFGLILRDQRLRATLPWRGDPSIPAAGGVFPALGKIVLTLAVLVGVIGALIVAQPDKFRITRSTTIDAPPAKVFAHVNDFHKWNAWSPWAKLDPDCKYSFEGPEAGKDAIFKWSGNDNVGEGLMTLKESKPGELIRIKLEFIRPFPDASDIEFTFQAQGDKTLVTWTMTGERDLLGKAICSFMSMETMVGGSFKEGLENMKTVVEKKGGDGK